MNDVKRVEASLVVMGELAPSEDLVRTIQERQGSGERAMTWDQVKAELGL